MKIEVQALAVLIAGVLGIAVAPQRQAETVQHGALIAFSVAAPLTLVVLPRFWRNLLITIGCWLGLWTALTFMSAVRGPLSKEPYILPAQIIILGLPAAGLLHWMWLKRERFRMPRLDPRTPLVQFVIAMAVAAAGIFVVPREASIVVAFLVVTLFTVIAPLSLAFRPTFFLNALLTFGLWFVLFLTASQLVEVRRPMREDAMIFLLPFMMILPALAAGGIAHYVRRRSRSTT